MKSKFTLFTFLLILSFTSITHAENFFLAAGDSCSNAIVIAEGTFTVDTLVGSGAVVGGATAAKWYSYTPGMNGFLNINSCGGGADTRLNVWTGDCSGLASVIDNDDACDLGNGDDYASEVVFAVTGGTEYLINWDDRWEAIGFDFSVIFNTSPPDPTCDQPFIVINDEVDTYPLGDVNGMAPHWSVWPGAAASGIVSDDFAFSGTQSVKIDGSVAGQDALFLLGDPVGGHYAVGWKMYIPSGNDGYFNLQHTMPTTSAGFWAFEVFFENDGEGRFLNSGTAEETSFSYTPDEWFDVIIFCDIDSDEGRMIIGDVEASATTVVAWTFSDGNTTSNGLNSINFYPGSADVVFYVDDLLLAAFPEATTGNYCYTAVPITEGVHSVPELECFGAAYFINDSGFAGYWFEYTATEDGVISIASCGGGADSRGWIFDGECHNLRIQGINDDRCDLGDGNEYASYREAVVTAGNTYYILWDDIWETNGFDFELAFTAGALTPGYFCQSAIAVGINQDIFTENYGEASVAGPVISNYTSATTPYAGSAWYSFTPSDDAIVDITACDGTTTDTRLWVYTGDCDAFETLTLVASDDDGCGSASIVSELAVTGGTTYFIEWDDEFSNAPIIWRINYSNAVNYTFNVDMSLQTVDAGGVFVAGSFSGWENVAMDDSDGDEVWSVTTQVPPSADIAYKFKNGPDGWETLDTSVGDDCTAGGFGDRALTTGMADANLPEVCFNYCVSCDLVDIDELALGKGVSVFPNPATDQVFLQFSLEESIDLEIRVINTLGQVVSNRVIKGIQQETIGLGVAHLPPGTYFIQMTNDDISISKKVIIQ
jgi:type IX secretion system substrate protein